MKKLLFSLSLILIFGTQSAWSKDANLEDLFKALDKDQTYGGTLTFVDMSENAVEMGLGANITGIKIYASDPESDKNEKRAVLKETLLSMKASGDYVSLMEVKENDANVKMFLRKEGDQTKELAIIVIAVEDGEEQLVIMRMMGDFSAEMLQEIMQGVNL